MPVDAYTVRAAVEPGRSIDNDSMPREVLIRFLRRLADGLEQHPDTDLGRLAIGPAPGQRADVGSSVYDRATGLYDGLCVELLRPEIEVLIPTDVLRRIATVPAPAETQEDER